LQSSEPGTFRSHESFESFVNNRPVFQTFENELITHGIKALKPLARIDVADGVALPDEVTQIVMNRNGNILAASTILKSDFFSGLQKMSLPERIEGAPNFRRLALTLDVSSESGGFPDGKMVCGSGMPTVQGLRRALTRVNADPNGHNAVFWTSLREEPVLYVVGRPHVLRLVDRPLVNVEQKGVSTKMVEAMENSLKRDAIRELRANGGRILLHDEVEDPPNTYTVIPLWERVTEEDIMTPRDVFDLMAKEGYKVDYARVAITDEQAPLPAALGEIFERVKRALNETGDLIFNCQMGRGRTTSGMVVASLVATALNLDPAWKQSDDSEADVDPYDMIEGYSEETAYLQGEYRTILQLVGVLSHGKLAKRLTDRAIDRMQDVQNLRKAIYDYKLKAEASDRSSSKYKSLMSIGINYLYRYGTLIAFANYLAEVGESKSCATFPAWLEEHREITKLLARKNFD